MTLWRATVHQFYDCLRILGLRDRLRCPKCKAVGTWKPHGGFLDFGDIRKVRRWMCKWCGYYSGPEGELYCQPDIRKGYWDLPALGEITTEFLRDGVGRVLSPKNMVLFECLKAAKDLDLPYKGTDEKIYTVDPWRG